jgi:hypothetical protein
MFRVAKSNWLILKTNLIHQRIIPEEEMKELLEDEDYTQIKSLTSFLKSTFTLVVTLVSFLYTLEAFANMMANEKQIKYMFSNWEYTPIEDIIVFEGDKICPDNYSYLISRHWNGMNSGCVCSSKNGEKISFGECDLKQVRRNCTTIKEIKPRNIHQVNGLTI